jgi:hypothetical protein
LPPQIRENQQERSELERFLMRLHLRFIKEVISVEQASEPPSSPTPFSPWEKGSKNSKSLSHRERDLG